MRVPTNTKHLHGELPEETGFSQRVCRVSGAECVIPVTATDEERPKLRGTGVGSQS